MDFSIHGLGGAYTQNRKSLSRRRARNQTEAEEASPMVSPAHEVEKDGWLSEHKRAEIAGIDQAVQATETALAMVQTAHSAVKEVDHWISVMAEVAAQAVEVTAGKKPDANRLDWLLQEFHKAREASDNVVESASFGKLRLLDGSLGMTGQAFGEGLAYVGASSRSRSSPPEGFPVHIVRAATQAEAVGDRALLPEVLKQALRLAIEADGRQAVLYPGAADSAEKIAAEMRARARENELEVQVEHTVDGRLRVRHARYGSAHCFTLRSSVPGVLSMSDGRPRFVNNGLDVVGLINGEQAFGEGEVLTGCAGNRTTDGLSVRYSGGQPKLSAVPELTLGRRSNWDIGLDHEGPIGDEVGRVILSHQPMVFRLGMGESETVSLSLNSMRSGQLGIGVESASGYASLAEIRLATAQLAMDAQEIIQRAREEVVGTENRLEELSSQVLEKALARLRARAETVSSLLSNIGDPRVARQLTQSLREQLHAHAGLALVAQPNPVPGTMMRLLA